MADWDPNWHLDDAESHTREASPERPFIFVEPRNPAAVNYPGSAAWFERLLARLPVIPYFDPPPRLSLALFKIPNMTRVEEFVAGHQDRVTALHVNFDGTRILTASADHRLKVWERNRDTAERTLTDTWTAHDADIRDAKWLHPTTGTHIASLGSDLRFKLWTEDPSQPPNSGRRFKLTSTIQNATRVPFVSLDFKTIDSVYTYLALIDRQGLLSVYEPSNPDEFKDWTMIDQWHVVIPPPGRGEETSFRVRFDPNPMPLPYVNSLSDDKNMLSLVATAMTGVKIYRSVVDAPNTAGENSGSNATSKKMTFYEAASLPVHPLLVRDVQWAPFNVRGTDLFATACKDGAVRIYEMEITPNAEAKDEGTNNNGEPNQANASARLTTPHASSWPSTQPLPVPNQPQSSLTTAITSTSRSTATASGSSSVGPSIPYTSGRYPHPPENPNVMRYAPPRPQIAWPYTHTITQVADLADAHEDSWAVAWNPEGQILMSNGFDAITKMWKKGIKDNGWMLFADQEVSFESDGEGEAQQSQPQQDQEASRSE